MAFVPSPNIQSQPEGVFVEVSLNITLSGAGPVLGVAVKLAAGTAGFRTVM